MRMTIYLDFGGGAELPLSYQHLQQGLIYHTLTENRQFSDVHDNRTEGKNFRPFTFGPLIGKFRIMPGRRISFSGTVSFTISTSDPMMLHYLYNAFQQKNTIRLGQAELPISRVHIHPDYEPTGKIRMLAPCTVWVTEEQADGKQFSRYMTPLEPEFSQLIEGNARAKYLHHYGKEYEGDFEFAVESVGARDKVVTYYKNHRIEGWKGSYILRADRDLEELLHDTGLGGKNAQGFGLFKWIGEKGRG